MMKNLLAIGVIAACGLAGCTTTLFDRTRYLSPGARTKCSPQRAKVCQDIAIVYEPATGKYVTDIDELEIATTDKQVHLYWQLPQGCNFYEKAGDGVFLKYPADIADQQFSRMFPTDDKDQTANHTEKEKAARYHWLNANNQAAKDKPYKYNVLFHCDSDLGRQILIDPTIRNQG